MVDVFILERCSVTKKKKNDEIFCRLTRRSQQKNQEGVGWTGMGWRWSFATLSNKFVFKLTTTAEGECGRRILEHHTVCLKSRLWSGHPKEKQEQSPDQTRPNQHIQGLPTHFQRGGKPTAPDLVVNQKQEGKEGGEVGGGGGGGHLRRLGAQRARRRADGEEEKQEGSRSGQRSTSGKKLKFELIEYALFFFWWKLEMKYTCSILFSWSDRHRRIWPAEDQALPLWLWKRFSMLKILQKQQMISRWRAGTPTLDGSIQRSQRRGESLPRRGGMEGDNVRWRTLKYWQKLNLLKSQNLDRTQNIENYSNSAACARSVVTDKSHPNFSTFTSVRRPKVFWGGLASVLIFLFPNSNPQLHSKSHAKQPRTNSAFNEKK